MSVTINDIERRQFQVEGECSVDDTMHVSLSQYTDYNGDKRSEFRVRLEQPWAGDTESGFGESCSALISIVDMVDFANWILAVATKEAM